MKNFIIIFLILALIPVFIGKVKMTQFGDFFKSPSWDGFKTAFSQLIVDDYNYYKDLVIIWSGKLIDLIKQKIAT